MGPTAGSPAGRRVVRKGSIRRTIDYTTVDQDGDMLGAGTGEAGADGDGVTIMGKAREFLEDISRSEPDGPVVFGLGRR